MRSVILALLTIALTAAENLRPDDLFGHWVVDDKALSKEQMEAAAKAAQIEGFGITITLRTARILFSADELVSGMWRLDDATPTTATLVIQPKGADERRYRLTMRSKRMTIDECPGKLPLKNTR